MRPPAFLSWIMSSNNTTTASLRRHQRRRHLSSSRPTPRHAGTKLTKDRYSFWANALLAAVLPSLGILLLGSLVGWIFNGFGRDSDPGCFLSTSRGSVPPHGLYGGDYNPYLNGMSAANNRLTSYWNSRSRSGGTFV